MKSQWGLIAALLGAAALVSCSGNRQADEATQAASAAARIQALPAANLEPYRKAASKGWANPYLILKADGVALLDVPNHEEHLLKPDDLPQALANLPASAWPYGRVVAVTEVRPPRSAQEDVRIREVRGIVAGTLESLHVEINWIPPR